MSKIITRYKEDYVYISENENGNKVEIDMREPDLKKGQSPTEILLSALSTCVAVDIVLILKKKRKTVKDLIIETEGTRREKPPRSYTHITSKYILLSPDTTEEEMRKISEMALRKYCSVADSLKANIDFSVEVHKE